jgi:predicted exporter
MLTSVCGFAALLPSDFPGLSQLGLYSVAGLIAAGLVTRYLLPQLLPANFAVEIPARLTHAATGAFAVLSRVRPIWLVLPLAAALLVLVTHRAQLWNPELAALSPVPPEAQALDARLRGSLGAPDVSLVVAIEGPSADAAVQAAEHADAALQALIANGTLAAL